jgi:outer membrane protein assembly factor BamB
MILLFILILPSLLNDGLAEATENESTIISSEQYGKGYRYNIQGWIYLHIEGEAYERGYQHGYLLADEIVDMLTRWSSIFPQKWSWKKHRWDAHRLFWNKYPDEYQQEIKGIADGVTARGGAIEGDPVTYKDILTMNEMYEMLSRFRTYSVYPHRLRSKWFMGGISYVLGSFKSSSDEHDGKCSAFMATGDATVDGRVVAAQSTFGGKGKDSWWHNYIAERFNVILDIKPDKGYRILLATSPGMIWSDEDFYQNSAGMILMETTIQLGTWSRRGDPLVVRVRKAIQYSDSIDDIVSCLLEKNNGLFANDWLIGDTKTGEIASLELALHNHGLTRTKNGVIWSCNNIKNDKVRWELYSFFGLGIFGRIFFRDFKPSNRDIKFEELLNEYHGEIDIDMAKKILSTSPINSGSTDCKITDSQMIDNFGLWCFMGKPGGSDFIASEYPLDKNVPGYTDLPMCGWVQLYALSTRPEYHSNIKTANLIGKQSKIFWEHGKSEEVLGNAVYSSPIIVEETLYSTSWSGNITAIDATTGRQLWEKNIGWGSTSSPTVADDMVFVGSNNGLYALNKKTGEIIWENNIGVVSSKPAFFDDTIFCGSHDGNVYAFDSEDGGLEWICTTNGGIYSSPIVNNNVLYIGSNDGRLYAIDISNGETIWSYKTDGPVCSSPLVYDDVVYFGSWDNNLYALNSETGNLDWKFTAGWGIDSSPTIRDDVLYVGCSDNNLYAIDAEDGALKWIFTANADIQSSPTIYGGFVFFGCGDGKIYALDASNGALVWSNAPDYHIQGIYNYVTKPIVSSPVAYNGRIYIGSTNGKIYCFDAGTYESPSVVLEADVSVDTWWFFLILLLIFVILVTALYLYWNKRK